MPPLVNDLRDLLIELADELSLYGYGIQEHARCAIIQELVERARLAAGAPPMAMIGIHPYSGRVGAHCNICMRSPQEGVHRIPKGTESR